MKKDVQPPQAIEVEQIVLGNLITFSKDIFRINTLLKPHHFYEPQHEIIYQCILDLSINGQITTIKIIQELKKIGKLDECGGAFYISKLESMTSSSYELENFCKIIIEKWINRRVISICTQSIEKGYQETTDAFDLMGSIQEQLVKINKDIDSGYNQTIENIVDEFAMDITNAKLGKSLGLKTNLVNVDKLTGGYKGGKMYILAARPGIGKTAFAVNNAFQMLLEDKKIVFHNLEMPNKELISRFIGLKMKESPSHLCKGNVINIQGYEEALLWLKSRKLFVFNHSKLSTIVLNTKMIMATEGCDCVFVDYIQLVENKEKNITRNDELTAISRTLKTFSVANDIPIVALAQLSRAVEQRHDKRPMLSDLRESGALEQDADVVQFLWRPEYYGIDYYDMENNGNEIPTEGLCQIITAKHRGGGLGDININWNGTLNLFSDSTL
jgi:replicative DNA helicase